MAVKDRARNENGVPGGAVGICDANSPLEIGAVGVAGGFTT